MLIVRSPVRLSFFGGGTDLPAYYRRFGGCVLSTTIDKYVYVILNVSDRADLQIVSSDYRSFYRHRPGEPLLWDGDLSLPRAVLEHFGLRQGLSIFLASEVPPGTGLGSSSSVTVALVKAVGTACGYRLSPREVAELACNIEIDMLGKPIGVQDQFASAFGGFNWMTFNHEGVQVQKLSISPSILSELQSRLLLLFTGSARDSAQILSRQNQSSTRRDPGVLGALQDASELALVARAYLERGELDKFGVLLDQAWELKKHFASGITNEKIDRCYAIARNNGAIGGKIAGAGGGGFLVLYCEGGASSRVEMALASEGLRSMDFSFESDGARVLFNAGLTVVSANNSKLPSPARSL